MNCYSNILSPASSRFINYDILFGYFNKLIRTFTDNVYIYRAICYAIIVYGYVAFIKYVCPENVSALPFITLMIPYLKSFKYNEDKYRNIGLPDRLDIAVSEKKIYGRLY